MTPSSVRSPRLPSPFSRAIPSRLPLVPILALLALPTVHIWAEDAPGGATELEKKLQALQDRLGALEKDRVGNTDLDSVRDDLQVFKDQYANDREKRSPTSSRGITLYGTIQGRWAASTIENERGATYNEFDIPLAQIGVSGLLFRDYGEGKNLQFNVSLQTVHTGSLVNYSALGSSGTAASGTTTSATTNGANTPVSFANAFIRYAVLPTVDTAENQLNVTLGQQLVPFGVEGAAAEDVKPTIRQAQFSSLVPTRQIGLVVQGDLWPAVDYAYDYRAPLISYAAGVYNGTGANAGDDNPNKDLFGRLALGAPVDYYNPLRGLSVGASAYLGTPNLTGTTAANTAFAFGTGDSNRYGIDATWAHNPFSITYEYVVGVTDSVTGNTPAAARVRTTRAVGQQITLGYLFGEQFINSSKNQGKWDDAWPLSYQPYVRYDTYDPNTENNDLASIDDQTRIVSLGLNVFFAQTTKFQLQASHADVQKAQQSYNEIVAQFQYGF